MIYKKDLLKFVSFESKVNSDQIVSADDSDNYLRGCTDQQTYLSKHSETKFTGANKDCKKKCFTSNRQVIHLNSPFLFLL
jgi:hypothetical protein